ncbi:hypothetical protein Acr_25g0000760 [Actinidia rufa]|uniref:Uncharacterized protein n=1 Tax=Actinidia rufa TaxID=165716 RepID=A0A7J0GXW3_9ERIC|nr:hypothetical protein Acr_25g0000760 [Actinidia rufa]
MSQPISVDISDDEEPQNDAVSTRNPPQSKRQRTEPLSNPTFLVIDDDLTPQKPQVSTSTPLFVDETLMSGLSDSDFCIVKCTSKGSSEPQKFSGISGVICLESDNESENGSEKGNWKQNERSGIALDVVKDSELRSRLILSESYPVIEERVSVHRDITQMSGHSFSHLIFSDGIPQVFPSGM